MMYDAIVVGARCAGAPTAMLLARKGYQVLLLDRATFPSDHPMSTHLIYPPGVLRLRRWGVLDEIKESGCPPIHKFGLWTEQFEFYAPSLPADDVTEAYAPRRHVLDHILVRAAVRSGVKLLEGVSVQELIRDRTGAVTGVRARGADGTTLTERARIVVGADGTHSTVARRVGAEEYNARPALLGNWWTYWADGGQESVWAYAGDHRYVYSWPTNDGCSLVGVAWPLKDFRYLGTDIETEYFAALDRLTPATAKRLRGSKRAERYTRGSVRNFFRKPYGAGWALVGDAGYSKDPCTAAGITDAFHDVEMLVDALDAGLSGRRPMLEALADYERQRNDRAVPFYDFICDFAALEPFPEELVPIMKYIERTPEETTRAVSLFTQTYSPAVLYAPDNVQRLIELAQAES